MISPGRCQRFFVCVEDLEKLVQTARVSFPGSDLANYLQAS